MPRYSYSGITGTTTVDLPSGNATLAGRLYDDYNDITGNGTAFSPNNPAYIQMQFAQNKEELLKLRQEAIEWEINNANLQEQRAYEESYNSPLAQMQRMRQAGGNPDLVGSGGSGGVSPGAASTATMQPATVDDMPTPSSIAGVVFQGMEATGSFLSSLSSTLNAGIDFGQKVASFASQTSLVKNTALDKEIQTLGDIASLIPSDLSDEEFSQMVKSFVPDADDSFVSRVSAFNKSPEAQARYASSKNLANQEAARLSAYTPRTLSAIYSMRAFTETMATEISTLRTYLDRYLLSDETGVDFVPTDDGDFTAIFDDGTYTNPEGQRRRNVNKLDQSKVQNDLDKYLRLAEIVDTLSTRAENDAQSALEAYQVNPTPELWERYVAAYILSYNMSTLRADEMRQVFDLFTKHQMNEAISEVAMNSTGQLIPFSADFKERYYDYYKLLYGSTPENSTPLTNMSGALVQLLKKIILKK